MFQQQVQGGMGANAVKSHSHFQASNIGSVSFQANKNKQDAVFVKTIKVYKDNVLFKQASPNVFVSGVTDGLISLPGME